MVTCNPLPLELPWDSPSGECKEYEDYCTKKSLHLSPWTKIDTKSLCK